MSNNPDLELLNLPNEVFQMILFNCARESIFAILISCKDVHVLSEFYLKRITKHLYGKKITLFNEDVTWRWMYDSKREIPVSEQLHFTGVGKRVIVQRDVYEGDFVDGFCHGNGTYIWTRGDKYVGQWVSGHQQGQGTLIWRGGNRYEGGWMGGSRHGHGVYTWEVKGFNFQDGVSHDKFEGIWVKGNREGPGKYYWANGNFCEGYWRDDERTGGHFYEKLTDRFFDAPNVDTDGTEINLLHLGPVIKEAYDQKKCTYSSTGTGLSLLSLPPLSLSLPLLSSLLNFHLFLSCSELIFRLLFSVSLGNYT
jgi:hypothetical protein